MRDPVGMLSAVSKILSGGVLLHAMYSFSFNASMHDGLPAVSKALYHVLKRPFGLCQLTGLLHDFGTSNGKGIRKRNVAGGSHPIAEMLWPSQLLCRLVQSCSAGQGRPSQAFISPLGHQNPA